MKNSIEISLYLIIRKMEIAQKKRVNRKQSFRKAEGHTDVKKGHVEEKKPWQGIRGENKRTK